MSTTTADDAKPVSRRSIITRMDDACDRFEVAWKAGLRPRIEDYLGETPDPARATLFTSCLVLDLVYRRRQGEQPTPEGIPDAVPGIGRPGRRSPE